jgi:PncC family amidohydrolase
LTDLEVAFPLAAQVVEAASGPPPRTIASAESCTGGLLAAALTAVPGSSAVFLGGVVSYANAAKARDLAVPESLLREHGAVSCEVAEAMARGIRDRFGTTFGVSTTGVAGPGSSEAKPAGLVYVAVAGPAGVSWRQLSGDLGRHQNRVAAVEVALELLLGQLA